MNDPKMERQLDALFAAYREACPEVEPSANFMPELWRRIEARRPSPFALQRVARLVVSMAAAACLALVALTYSTESPSPVYLMSYVEALDAADSMDSLAYLDVEQQQQVPPGRP